MQCTPINNVDHDTEFSGCENHNDSKDFVTIAIFTATLFIIMVIII